MAQKPIEEVLGNPVGPGYDDNALKVRRNLIAAGFLGCIVGVGRVRLDPSSPIMGLRFLDLTDSILRIGLIAALLYLLVHFGWCAFEGLAYWRLRVTGTRLAFRTTGKFADERADYPDDPKQSTLHSWWLQAAEMFQRQAAAFEKAEASLNRYVETVREADDQHRRHSEVLTHLRVLKRDLDDATKNFANGRIPLSLSRFDQWFGMFLKAQNLRWLFIDTLLPILLGLGALLLLLFWHTRPPSYWA